MPLNTFVVHFVFVTIGQIARDEKFQSDLYRIKKEMVYIIV